nr:hypothetical protein Iba_chr12aCG21090 [Ipomoea batatas]
MSSAVAIGRGGSAAIRGSSSLPCRRRTVTPDVTIAVVTASPAAARLPPPLDERNARKGHCLRRHWSQELPPLLPFTLAPDFIETEGIVVGAPSPVSRSSHRVKKGKPPLCLYRRKQGKAAGGSPSAVATGSTSRRRESRGEVHGAAAVHFADHPPVLRSLAERRGTPEVTRPPMSSAVAIGRGGSAAIRGSSSLPCRRRTVTPDVTIAVVTASPAAARLPPPLDERNARKGHCLRRHWSQELPPLLPFTLAPDFIETEGIVVGAPSPVSRSSHRVKKGKLPLCLYRRKQGKAAGGYPSAVATGSTSRRRESRGEVHGAAAVQLRLTGDGAPTTIPSVSMKFGASVNGSSGGSS